MPQYTLLEKVRAERQGKPLDDGPTTRIRMAFLAGEKLGRADLARFKVTSTSNIHMAMGDLKRVGYRFDSEQIAPPRRGGLPTVVHWVTNPKHVPKTDTGPTRKFHPRKKKPAPVVVRTEGQEAGIEALRRGELRDDPRSSALGLGATFTLVGAELVEDGSVRYRLSDGSGRVLIASEGAG